MASVHLFLIRNSRDGHCMGLPCYGKATEQTHVTELPCDHTAGDNQLWWAGGRPDGTYWIRDHASENRCLDVFGHRSTASGLPLTLYSRTDEDDQHWRTGD